MPLTSAQRATLKTAIQADAQFNAAVAIADWPAIGLVLNADFAPAWTVWRPFTDVEAIYNAITWANLTPTDTPDGSAIALQREYRCQGKQLNLQILLQGRFTLATGRVNVRNGLSDALQNVPAGVSGAFLDAGWIGAGKVKTAIYRNAWYGEKIFSTGTGTTAVPADLVVVGEISNDDIRLAMTT